MWTWRTSPERGRGMPRRVPSSPARRADALRLTRIRLRLGAGPHDPSTAPKRRTKNPLRDAQRRLQGHREGGHWYTNRNGVKSARRTATSLAVDMLLQSQARPRRPVQRRGRLRCRSCGRLQNSGCRVELGACPNVSYALRAADLLCRASCSGLAAGASRVGRNRVARRGRVGTTTPTADSASCAT